MSIKTKVLCKCYFSQQWICSSHLIILEWLKYSREYMNIYEKEKWQYINKEDIIKCVTQGFHHN